MANLTMEPWGPPSQPCVLATDDSSATSKSLWYDIPRNDKGLEIFVLAQTPYRGD